MAIKTKNGWACSYCGKTYTHPELADSCRDDHSLIYIPISREDLNKLIHYLYVPDPKLLADTHIVNVLRKAQRIVARADVKESNQRQEKEVDLFSMREANIKDG